MIESWREALSCGRYQSKLLHPTPARVVAVRRYQANTNSTGLGSSSSSSGGKYNSETLKSGYESSTLSVQNVQKPLSRTSKPDKRSIKTATSDRVRTPSTINNASQTSRDSDEGDTTTVSIQDVKQPVTGPRSDKCLSETATSDRVAAPSTINAATTDQSNRDSGRGIKTTKRARKKSTVKIEVEERDHCEGNCEDTKESSKNTTKKHRVKIEVVEEV